MYEIICIHCDAEGYSDSKWLRKYEDVMTSISAHRMRDRLGMESSNMEHYNFTIRFVPVGSI